MQKCTWTFFDPKVFWMAEKSLIERNVTCPSWSGRVPSLWGGGGMSALTEPSCVCKFPINSYIPIYYIHDLDSLEYIPPPNPPGFEISQFLGEIKWSWSPNSTDLCFWYLFVDQTRRQTRSCKPNSRTCCLLTHGPMPTFLVPRQAKQEYNVALKQNRVASVLVSKERIYHLHNVQYMWCNKYHLTSKLNDWRHHLTRRVTGMNEWLHAATWTKMVEAKAEGKARMALQLQIKPIPIQRVVCEFRGASGVMMARYLSRVIASKVNTEAFTWQNIVLNWVKRWFLGW